MIKRRSLKFYLTNFNNHLQCIFNAIYRLNTVDGRNPAPVGRWFMLLYFHDLQSFIVTNSYKVLQEFFQPQYDLIKEVDHINR